MNIQIYINESIPHKTWIFLKRRKLMKNVLLWIWQLPQNLLGLVVLLFNKVSSRCVEVKYIDNIKYYSVKHVNNCGVSLGNYIFFDSDRPITKEAIHHERGHQKQSLKYGWLYLFIIGLPSAMGNIYSRLAHKDSKWYYSQWWERTADKLGGVVRS